MKKGRKKPAAKKGRKSAKRKQASASAFKGRRNKRVVNKQPQVNQEAAVAQSIFLYTDDAWSLRYFDRNDLHFKEREVFG